MRTERRTAVLCLAALLIVPVGIRVLADEAAPVGIAVAAGHAGVARVYRDAFGVPHVFVDPLSPDPLYTVTYANGYVQAQDRLWAMDIIRHISLGEGASVAGPSILTDFDLTTRRDLYSRADLEAMLAAGSPLLKTSLQAFSDGVNRAAAEMTASGNVPAEFAALNHPFEPWAPIDTVAVATFLLARFGGGGGDEISNAKVFAKLETTLGSTEAAWDAFADRAWVVSETSYPTIPVVEGTYVNAAVVDLKPDFASLPQAQRDAIVAAKGAEPFGLATVDVSMDDALLPSLPVFSPAASSIIANLEEAMRPENLKWGSNALLVGPAKSASGKAMVGGGPQTGYFNPQILYEVGLHGGGVDVAGVGVIGAPGVVLGRTGGFAWTVTSGISDQTDILALPADATTTNTRDYVWGGETRPLSCRTERHEVLNPPALSFTQAEPEPPSLKFFDQEVCFAMLSSTESAPIVAVKKSGSDVTWFFASRTSSRMRELASAEKWLNIGAADDLAEFKAAFNDALAPFAFTFNFHFAGRDAAGSEHICYFHVGRQPVRHPDLDPRFPTPAGDVYLWSGAIYGDALPNDCDPAQGYYANWNNLPQRGWSSGDGRELWGSLHRVERLNREVEQFLASPAGSDDLDLDEVKTILRRAATEDSFAWELAPIMDDATNAPVAAAALAAWAGDDYAWKAADGNYTDRGHTVYDRLLPALLTEVFGDELGSFVPTVNWDPSAVGEGDPHAADHGEHQNPFAVLEDALTPGATGRNWCDDVTTGDVEGCATAIENAYAAAGLTGYVAAGDVPPTAEHFTKFSSLGLGPKYIGRLNMTNRATYYHFHVGTDIASSSSAIAPGQSGHVGPLDAPAILLAGGDGPTHMHDQLDLYRNFGFKPVYMTEGQLAAAGFLGVPLFVAGP